MLSFSKNTVFTMNYAAAIFIPFWHRAGSVAEQSRAEPSRAGLSRAEPSRAEQGQAEPSRASAETSRAEIRGGKYTLLCCGGFREGLLTSPRHNQPYDLLKKFPDPTNHRYFVVNYFLLLDQ